MNIHGYRQTRVHTFIPIHTFIPPLVLAPTSACGKRRDIHTFRCKYKRESSYVPGPYIINKSVTGAFLAATSLGRLAQLSLPHQRTRAHFLPHSCLFKRTGDVGRLAHRKYLLVAKCLPVVFNRRFKDIFEEHPR